MFRPTVFFLFLLLNLFAYLALRRAALVWITQSERQRRILRFILLAVFLINVPLLVFFIRPADANLQQFSPSFLRVFFYPSTAWLATILFFFVLAGPLALLGAVGSVLHRLVRKRTPRQGIQAAPAVPPGPPALSRRGFLAGSAGLLIPAIYGVAAYGAYGDLDELEVSPERSVPIPHLPRSLEGLTIVQLSDLHVGPYIRERELRRVVSLTNQLRPDVVVLTGDILDRHLVSLPDAVRGLSGIEAPLGVFAVLGNHDISSDRYSYTAQYRGGVKIAQGLETIGIRTLRNQVIHLGPGQDRLALMGLDWLSADLTGANFFAYQPVPTRRQLRLMAEAAGPETPRVLLAHHPDTFSDALPYEIGLTLSGHTHGGGQVILGHAGGVPIGVAMFRFKYLSGLYQENGCSLYVNRGIGYLGIPIRINCPPEISRFKLARPPAS